MSTLMIERESVEQWVGAGAGQFNDAVQPDESENGLPCHSEDPELFFAESPTDVELAKQVCGPCPLRRPCLDAALERREPWGVWGGELVQQGVVVARKRGPGRPRKDAAPLVAAS